MGIDLRLPNIPGPTDREKLSQMQSYLYQLVGQLQWALQNVDTSNATVVVSTPRSQLPSASGSYGVALTGEGDDPQSTFNSIKALIIKSADIVEAYYEEINKRLEEVYVAQSDFGDFAQKTAQEIEATSTSTTQRFENVQVIISNHDKEIASIDGTLQTMGQELSYTQNGIVTIMGDVDSISSHVANIETNVGDLDNDLKTTAQTLTQTITDTEGKLTTTIINTKTEIEGSIGAAVSTAKSYTDTAKSELESSLDGARAELSGKVNEVEAELQSTQTALSGSIDNAKTELAGSINSTKNELSGSIDAAKSQLASDINGAKSELTGMVNDVDADLQETKTATNERIDDTNGSVANLGAGLNDANSRIAEVDQDLQDSKQTISNNIQGVRDTVTGVNALLEDAKAQLQGSLDDLEVYITEMQSVIIGVTAYLKSGLLYYTDAGVPVYGLEVGQSVKDEMSGTEVFKKYARFTSEKLSFYDSNGNEVAYISDKKLFIRIAEITVAFKIGGLMDLVMDNGDVVTKWVGG